MPTIDEMAPEWNEDIDQQLFDDELRQHEAMYPRGKQSAPMTHFEGRDELFDYDLHRNPPPDESR